MHQIAKKADMVKLYTASLWPFCSEDTYLSNKAQAKWQWQLPCGIRFELKRFAHKSGASISLQTVHQDQHQPPKVKLSSAAMETAPLDWDAFHRLLLVSLLWLSHLLQAAILCWHLHVGVALAREENLTSSPRRDTGCYGNWALEERGAKKHDFSEERSKAVCVGRCSSLRERAQDTAETGIALCQLEPHNERDDQHTGLLVGTARGAEAEPFMQPAGGDSSFTGETGQTGSAELGWQLPQVSA